eukprot:tig00022075_g23632.t1
MSRPSCLPFFDVVGHQRYLDFRVGQDACIRVPSGVWCELIQVLARELNVPYAALLRHPKYGQSLEAVRSLIETGVYELPAEAPALGLRERRFAERKAVFEKRAAAVAAGGYIANPVSPRSAKRPWRLPELDVSTFRDYEPGSKSALGSFVDWPSPRVILHRRHNISVQSSRPVRVLRGEPEASASCEAAACAAVAADCGAVDSLFAEEPARPSVPPTTPTAGCLSSSRPGDELRPNVLRFPNPFRRASLGPVSGPSSSGLSRASGSPSAEEVLACKRERQAQEEACEASCKRSRRDPMSAASAASPGLSFSGSSSPAPLSAASASSLSSASSSCSSARPRRVRRAPRQQTACQASRSRSEGLAGLSKTLDHTLSQLLSSHFAQSATAPLA